MSAPLNLASRPFRNTRLPRLLLGLSWLGLAALTALQALLVYRLLPAQTEPRWREARRLETQLATLAEREQRSRTNVPSATLKRWAALREIVDRRAFSWSRLLQVLEEATPPGVRYLSLAPQPQEDGLGLEFEAEARSQADVLELVRALEARPEFEQVYPRSIEEAPGGRRVRCSMRYRPSGEEQP